jgi:integrase
MHRPATARKYLTVLRALYRDTATTPSTLTETELRTWCCAETAANNTVRGRITAVTAFYNWLDLEGHPHQSPASPAAVRAMRRAYPKTYGRAQAPTPARWLTRHEAFDVLVPACQDGTLPGLRDELLIRLGLSGLRATELANLTFGSRTGNTLRWTGKARRPRTITIGSTLSAVWDTWTHHYRRANNHEPAPTTVLLCGVDPHARPHTAKRHGEAMAWGHPLHVNSIRDIVVKRARTAGLGHLAPHDLRRTAAGILHHDTDEHGAHHFDLLDIQKVLGHADPATTMRSYLDPMDTGVLDRAATILD